MLLSRVLTSFKMFSFTSCKIYVINTLKVDEEGLADSDYKVYYEETRTLPYSKIERIGKDAVVRGVYQVRSVAVRLE